jgi:hypothetical protein
MGAGIIPVSFVRGRIYLLFGREAADGKWSDFGGGKEGNETPFKTAIREGCEELCGFLGCQTDLARKVRENKLMDLHAVTYNTYLFEIPYDPYLPDYFNKNFAFIKKNFPQLLEIDGMFEKSEIRWFDLYQLRNNRNMFRPFYRNVIDEIIANKDKL